MTKKKGEPDAGADLARPAGGGSYVRNTDGSLTRVEATASEAAPAVEDTTPAGDPPAIEGETTGG